MYAVVETGGKQYKVEEGSLPARRSSAPPRRATRSTCARCCSATSEVVPDPKTLEKVKVEAKVAEHLRGEKIKSSNTGEEGLPPPRRPSLRADQARGDRDQDADPQSGGKESAARKSLRLRRNPRRKRRPPMAHKKGLGSSRNGRDSNPKMLGVKVFAGQKVERRRDHRAPARHPLLAGRGHRPGPRPHDLRHAGRDRRFKPARAAAPSPSSD